MWNKNTFVIVCEIYYKTVWTRVVTVNVLLTNIKKNISISRLNLLIIWNFLVRNREPIFVVTDGRQIVTTRGRFSLVIDHGWEFELGRSKAEGCVNWKFNQGRVLRFWWKTFEMEQKSFRNFRNSKKINSSSFQKNKQTWGTWSYRIFSGRIHKKVDLRQLVSHFSGIFRCTLQSSCFQK